MGKDVNQDNAHDSEQNQDRTHAEDVSIVPDQPDRAPAQRIAEDPPSNNKSNSEKQMVRLTAALALFALAIRSSWILAMELD